MTDKKTTAKKKESIHQALFRFHSLFHGATKTGVNPHFKSEHFTLDDVIKATTPVLQECGLFVTHRVGGNALHTAINNEHGGLVESSIPLPQTDNPQVTGSCLTYFKRYNLTNLLNIAEADDDGNAATDAANLGEAHRKERKARPPQAGATDQQIEGLREYQAKYALNDRQNDYIDANIEKLTILDAADLIKKLDEAKAAGTLKLKEKQA